MHTKSLSIMKIASKTRRRHFVGSELNMRILSKQFCFVLPLLKNGIFEINIKQYETVGLKITDPAQLFINIEDETEKDRAIHALEYIIFCFENGCKSLRNMIRRELLPVITGIEHLIDFELKKIIKKPLFSLFDF